MSPLVLALVALPGLAAADTHAGLYVDLGTGASLLGPITSYDSPNGTLAPFVVSAKNNYAIGFAEGLGIGYAFSDGLRLELNGNFARNAADTVMLNGGSWATAVTDLDIQSSGISIASHGAVNQYGAMLNLLWDLPLGFALQPYVGGGFGYQWVTLSNAVSSPFPGVSVAGSAGAPAYDLIGGVSYPVAAIPGLDVGIEYRYTDLLSDPKFKVHYPATDPDADSDADYLYSGSRMGLRGMASHSFMVTLRYTFGAAPAAVAVAAAPADTPAPVRDTPAPSAVAAGTERDYLIVFAPGSADLSAQATNVLAGIVAELQGDTSAQAVIEGYADAHEGANAVKLAAQRADQVAQTLERAGIAPSRLAMPHAVSLNPLIPDNAAEIQAINCRVEIKLNQP
ncbi:OmpA family protein [Acidocella sp.]|uniref:OmpA family protein n=1 Tax=Acidocella sp. TaxID=50710 RepID=UPI002626BE51|nr:OmpA family protein [Acidocella sp.]